MTAQPKEIFGTTLFNGRQARKGYALNKMCFSFNHAENREKFKADEDAYMKAYGLNEQQAKAIRERDVLGLLAAGGNVYYLAKFAGIRPHVQDLGAAQTGLSKEDFKAPWSPRTSSPRRSDVGDKSSAQGAGRVSWQRSSVD